MEIDFSEDEPFLVKNSIGILLFLAVVCILMFISLISYKAFSWTDCLVLIPALPALKGLIIRKPMIEVSKAGIFSNGELVTDWPHFIDATFTQRPKKNMRSNLLADNFILVVQYNKEGFYNSFRCVIPLSNTQNKSEEAVLAAIQFFYKSYREKPSQVEHSRPQDRGNFLPHEHD